VKKWIGTGMICLFLWMIFIYPNPSYAKEKQMVTAFEETGFQMIQTNIHTWGKISDQPFTYEEMEEEVDHISQALGIEKQGIVEKKTNDNIREYIMTRPSSSAKTTIKIESIQNQETTDTYAIIDIVLYEGFESTLYFKELSKTILEEQNIKPTTHVTMTGTYPGPMELSQKEKMANTIMEALNAKTHKTFQTDQIYNQYGYTPVVEEWIKIGKEKVNIDLALRYNEYEDNTYLYLATPVITVEY